MGEETGRALDFIHPSYRWDFLQIDPRMHTRASSDQGPDFQETQEEETDEGLVLPMQHRRSPPVPT